MRRFVVLVEELESRPEDAAGTHAWLFLHWLPDAPPGTAQRVDELPAECASGL
jgi:hypothetical protein